jgi:hypothetical protein
MTYPRQGWASAMREPAARQESIALAARQNAEID